MAKIKETEELQKHTLWLYRGDFERIGSFFPDLGASIAIRRTVRRTIEKLETDLPKLRARVGEDVDV